MSIQVTLADPAEYKAAVSRKTYNARHAAALELADVAEAHCRQSDATASDLAAMDEKGWKTLNVLAGRTRPASPETRAMVVAMVADRLTLVCA